MRAAFVASMMIAGLANPLFADVDVTQAGGRISVRADRAPVSEVLDRIADHTAMRVVYDGAPPPIVLTRTLLDQTPVGAVVGLLEGLALKYAMALDESGTRVRVLLITTEAAPPRALVPEPVASENMPVAEIRPPDFAVPAPESEAQPSAPPSVPVAPAEPPAPPAYASYAGPFTPQGPGPVILPLPGAAVVAVAAAAAATPIPARTPLDMPTAAMPPWMKAGYYGSGN